MSTHLRISTGQHSDKGVKPLNQDFHAVMVPKEPLLSTKGIAVAMADGISSSDVSQIASETSVAGFLSDYYSTSSSWSVKNSVHRVLRATNSWLYAQTRNGPYRYDIEKGYVCTFSAIVMKSATAHIFHAGDTRVSRVANGTLEPLTEDHRLWLSSEKSYLSRAMGMRDQLEIDYQVLAIEPGDIFVLATDGVYEFIDASATVNIIDQHSDNLDEAARLVVAAALAQGSDDNLTLQIVRVDQIGPQNMQEFHHQASGLPFPPELRPRSLFDGYSIIRELHHSPRSHVYLAVDEGSSTPIILKTPSVELRDDAAYLEAFLMEEWVARRVDNVHLLKPCTQTRKRNYLYITTEFIDGQTLSQWMLDHPSPDIEAVRNLLEQVGRGLQAMHRQEMLHQDLRPNNIMIDKAGTAKIIDFGSVRVAGVEEITRANEQQSIRGTMQFTAPEYFIGEPASNQSDIFSLGVIAYQMLSGRLPYGTSVARATTRAAQRKLVYQSVRDDERTIPAWVDSAIRKAVHPDPRHRYHELSEFLYDLRHPNPVLCRRERAPLLERNPILFWKGLAFVLAVVIVILLVKDPLLG